MRSSTSRWAAMLQVVPRRRLRITVERVVLELGLCACFRSTVDCTVSGARGPRAGAAYIAHLVELCVWPWPGRGREPAVSVTRLAVIRVLFSDGMHQRAGH